MTVRKVLTTPDEKLRLKSHLLTLGEVKSDETKALIADIYDTMKAGEYGVGMSAIQVGEPVAAVVVMIRPTPNRPNLEHFNRVYLNLKIIKTFGEKKPMWEGCCSVQDDDRKPVYSKVPRYEKIEVEYLDEEGVEHKDVVYGFLAHVLQHEADHLEGVIFTDLVPAESIVSQEVFKEAVKRGE